jgi:hypothetical protein
MGRCRFQESRMPVWPKGLVFMACAIGLVGCAAFIVDRGEVTTPTISLTRPNAASLPQANSYVDLAGHWRKQTTLGVAGYAEATLWDPLLAAAGVAHEGALEQLSATALDARLSDRWDAYYGTSRDRFPIDIHWRFDNQFYTNTAILSPDTWRFVLSTDDERHYAPLAVVRLDQNSAPQAGFYEGNVRLWFPWREENGSIPILGGQTTGVTLTLKSDFGQGTLNWRFHNQSFNGSNDNSSF